MAAITFPSSPTTGQTFSSGSSLWNWDGTAWRVVRQISPEPTIGFSKIDGGTASTTGAFYNSYFILSSSTPTTGGSVGSTLYIYQNFGGF